jgi:uncharacterized protein (TIGR03382 family)
MNLMHRLRVLTFAAIVVVIPELARAAVIATADDPTAFGVVTVATAKTVNVAVSNSVADTLTVTSAAITGGGASWFSFAGVPQSSCNSGTSCNFIPDLTITTAAVNVAVRCQPPASATGSQTQTLTFASDSAAGGDNTVTLTCTAGRPDISPSATSLSYGNVDVGATAAQTLTVTNTGSEALTINTATLLTGTEFEVTMGQTGTQVVLPTQSTSWMLACKPTVEGALTDTFRISSNAVNTPTLNIALTCTGGRLTSDQTSFDFGAVRAGDTVTRTFSLRNTGTATVSGIAAQFSANANVKGYTIEGLPTTLAGNTSRTVTVRFSPVDTNSGTLQTVKIVGTYPTAQATMTRVMTLNGDGLSSGYTFDPAALDIGAVRWDRTRDGTLTIKNPFESTVQITSVMVNPQSGTASGEIALAPAGTFPRSLAPNASITLNLRADPNNRLGALAATVIVNSDLGASAMPTRTATVTATSTSAAITADPATMMYDFGAVDVDLAPASKDLTLRNSGDATLDITSATIAGANSAYSVIAVTPAVVLPQTDFTVTVRYDPEVVKTAENELLTIGVVGVLGNATMTATFMLTGRGIDRGFSITEPALFPETFRNPGKKAPVQEVTVRNSGQAPLRIEAAMVTGAPIWSLVDYDDKPVVIPGDGSAIFKVRFAPVTGGQAPTGQLMFTHDDDQTNRQAIVSLNGFGKNPMLSVIPSTVISLGTTAVGFPVKLSDVFPDLLSVRNNDSETFRVRTLALRDSNGGSAFALSDDLKGQDLAPGQSRQFDIVFSASSVGEFAADLEIYLDEDSEPATIVRLTGTAVEVDVKGGGGCQSSSPGSAALAAFLVLGWLLMRRRRHRTGVAIAIIVIAMTSSHTSDAQTSRNVDLLMFRPAPATTGDLLQVQAPTVGARGEWELGVQISHAVNPLQVTTSMGDTSNLVANRTTFDLGLAFAFANRFEIGAKMMTFNQNGDQGGNVRGLEPGVGTAVGDALLHAKVKLAGGRYNAIAVTTGVTLPTATDNAFAGSGSLGASGQLLLGAGAKRWSAAANVGFGYQEKVELGNITQGNRALVGAGASLRASDGLTLSAEVFGAIAIGQRKREAASPMEALFGLRYRVARSIGVAVGVGTGIVRGIGAPVMHGLIAFELSPNARSLEPLRPPRPYTAPADRDGDGRADKDDSCPDQAEDLDGFGDSDGCPDPDNDFDGIADGDDQCPLAGEDKDGIADADGCPDFDDDGDNIAEPADKCPGEMEDKDGFQDGDGCPDPDDDRDGIADRADLCPRQAEIINGNSDDDGCADPGESLVLLGSDRIDVLEPVTFAEQSAKLTPAAIRLLEQVAATLRAHPEIVRIRVGVHVNRRSGRDQSLSDKRAMAIREWLVQWGIAAPRIDSRGFGSEKLIVKAQRKDAGLVNNRVEFTIMERNK